MTHNVHVLANLARLTSEISIVLIVKGTMPIIKTGMRGVWMMESSMSTYVAGNFYS